MINTYLNTLKNYSLSLQGLLMSHFNAKASVHFKMGQETVKGTIIKKFCIEMFYTLC